LNQDLLDFEHDLNVINELFNYNHNHNDNHDDTHNDSQEEKNDIPDEIHFVLYFSVALAVLGAFECFGKFAFLDVYIIIFN